MCFFFFFVLLVCFYSYFFIFFFFFSSRRRHTRFALVSWARRCVQETGGMVVPQSPQGAVGDAQTGHHHHDGGDESLQRELENLSNEELVGVYQESNCIECLDILVRRNDGLLHHVIKRFAYSSEPYEDLFQVARIGLLKAAQLYDPTRADSFATYAYALVDGEVRHHLRDNLLVRIPRWAKSIYVRIMRTQQEYFQREGRSPTIAEIAQEI